ncbi:MAG: hypothetical protein Unbinned400contig1002_45 [Prokaryotic dsDNA virus sp.]|nr:MAG: hypothetical protein Unbinned400contig1002_45 [Prokaryotic dsDNA virus sp.]|tara:strand:- start:219 stop:572 length:354 start_codon:yes stop_codon:yes gene_type:complete
MNETTKAWLDIVPRLAVEMKKRTNTSGFTSPFTSEEVIWMALLMANGKISFMGENQIEAGHMLLQRYLEMAIVAGLITSDIRIYNPRLVEWDDNLESKGLTAFVELNRHFKGPVMEH